MRTTWKTVPTRCRRPTVRSLGLVVAALVATAALLSVVANAQPTTRLSPKDSIAAIVQKYLHPPASIGITARLSHRPASGKTIVDLACGVPKCKEMDNAMKQAAAALGWTVKDINTGTSLETTTQAFDRAIDTHPDGIHLAGIPASALTPQLARAKAAGISVVFNGVTGVAAKPVVALVQSTSSVKKEFEILADYIAWDSHGSGHAAIFNSAAFPILRAGQQGFTAELAKYCPKCTLTKIDNNLTDIGTVIPGKVVSLLQAHPEIRYLVFGFGDMSTGVPAALVSAGLQKGVKLLGTAPSDPNIQNIRTGAETAYAAVPSGLIGWALIDAFARAFNGDSLAPINNGVFPTWLITKNDLPTSATDQGIRNYQAQYKKLWRVG